MNKYWIPGPITNYGTTDTGFHGEVRVVLASDHEAWLADRTEERDDSNRNLTAALKREAALAARLADAEACIGVAHGALHGEGVEDQGQAWDKALKTLDAYRTADSASVSPEAKP